MAAKPRDIRHEARQAHVKANGVTPDVAPWIHSEGSPNLTACWCIHSSLEKGPLVVGVS